MYHLEMGSQPLPVTVLSGFLGAGKTTLLQHLLSNGEGLRIAVIVNDMSEINIDAQLLLGGESGFKQSQERLVELSNGCICCTLREDLLEEIQALAREGSFDYLLIESSGISEPLPVAVTFDMPVEGETLLSDIARLDTLVTVVDASTFLSQASGEQTVEGVDGERGLAELLIEQVEFADVVVLNKVDLVSDETLGSVEAFIRRLNPEVHFVKAERGQVELKELMGTGRYDPEKARKHQDWDLELSGVHTPETEEYGIRSFVYQARRPFHPQRLADVLHRDWEGVLRAKGFFWLASRSHTVGVWSLAGQSLGLEPAGRWWAEDSAPGEWPDDQETRDYLQSHWQEPWGDRRQELVFIGQEISVEVLRSWLDEALLNDEEMALGPEHWSRFLDPLPAWESEDVLLGAGV